MSFSRDSPLMQPAETQAFSVDLPTESVSLENPGLVLLYTFKHLQDESRQELEEEAKLQASLTIAAESKDSTEKEKKELEEELLDQKSSEIESKIFKVRVATVTKVEDTYTFYTLNQTMGDQKDTSKGNNFCIVFDAEDNPTVTLLDSGISSKKSVTILPPYNGILIQTAESLSQKDITTLLNSDFKTKNILALLSCPEVSRGQLYDKINKEIEDKISKCDFDLKSIQIEIADAKTKWAKVYPAEESKALRGNIQKLITKQYHLQNKKEEFQNMKKNIFDKRPSSSELHEILSHTSIFEKATPLREAQGKIMGIATGVTVTPLKDPNVLKANVSSAFSLAKGKEIKDSKKKQDIFNFCLMIVTIMNPLLFWISSKVLKVRESLKESTTKIFAGMGTNPSFLPREDSSLNAGAEDIRVVSRENIPLYDPDEKSEESFKSSPPPSSRASR